MPYIPEKERLLLWEHAVRLGSHADSPGHLNYIITKLVLAYIDRHGKRYATYNEVLGVLTAVQHELYRRAIVPYEDQKIRQNGDVYPGDVYPEMGDVYAEVVEE